MELGQIWDELDDRKEGSLTKDDIGAVYECKVEKYDELTRKQVDSIKDYFSKPKAH